MKDRIQKILNFLSQDINLKHNYFILGGIFLLLTLVGYTSYALFSYEVYAPVSINIVFRDDNGPTCNIIIPNDTVLGINTTASFTMNCTDSFDVVDKNITSTDFTITGDISISNITKERINNGYKYNISILSGTTDSVANIKLNSNVLQDGNGNYNNSITSDNITIVLYNTFYITYNNTNYEYHYDDGMNWTTFISSDYNDGNFVIDGSKVEYHGYKVAEASTAVGTTTALKEITYVVLPPVYAWNKYTRSSTNEGSAASDYYHTVIYDTSGGSETQYIRYYSTPAYSEIVEKGTTVSGKYSTYTNFNVLKGYYHIFPNNDSDPNSGWRNSIIRYVPSNATIKRSIGSAHTVYFTYSYAVTTQYITSENQNAYPQNGWSGDTIYYEYLGEV